MKQVDIAPPVPGITTPPAMAALAVDEGKPARTAGGRSIRVFILYDHWLVRASLRELLEGESFEVVGDAGSAAEAALRIPVLRPDVTVLDARLPDATGIEVCRDLRSADPSLNFLMLTNFDDEHALQSAILAGAAGYVPKEIRSTYLPDQIRRTAIGRSLFTSDARARYIDHLLSADQADQQPPLTAAEHRVLAAIVEGKTNQQIGQALSLEESAVRNHISSLLEKLGFVRQVQPEFQPARSS